MNCTFGENLSLTIFGQSHGEGIGMVLDGVPAGLPVELDALQAFLARRAPGQTEGASARKEADIPEFLGGIYQGRTCGAPIAAVIRNTDARPQDYDALRQLPRPGHADFPAQIKYAGAQDPRGGGNFSGRMTAPLCIAGGLCLQFLGAMGIRIHAEILEIGGETEPGGMQAAILAAKQDGDSVGGILECTAENLPVGLGGPLFGGLEGRIARAVFAIPGIKGVEFGEGFHAARLRGSQNNDEYTAESGFAAAKTNHAGGILGGISDGMPLVFRAAVKPTPSIAKPQNTVRLDTGEPAVLEIHGRHDACIVPRAIPCVEAAAALAIYDAVLDRKKEL